MTWIIFDNVHVWKLIHVCYFFTISLTLEEAASADEFGTRQPFFPDFTVRYGLKIYEWGV